MGDGRMLDSRSIKTAMESKMIIEIGKGMAMEIADAQIAQMETHAHVRERVWRIGLGNIVKDCHASIVAEDYKTDVEWRAAKKLAAEEYVAGLLIGESRTKERAPRVDDFTTAMRKYVRGLFPLAKRK